MTKYLWPPPTTNLWLPPPLDGNTTSNKSTYRRKYHHTVTPIHHYLDRPIATNISTSPPPTPRSTTIATNKITAHNHRTTRVSSYRSASPSLLADLTDHHVGTITADAAKRHTRSASNPTTDPPPRSKRTTTVQRTTHNTPPQYTITPMHHQHLKTRSKTWEGEAGEERENSKTWEWEALIFLIATFSPTVTAQSKMHQKNRSRNQEISIKQLQQILIAVFHLRWQQ